VFSVAGSLLFLLIGVPIIALGVEVARVFARVERWRMSFVDGQPLISHPYRPLRLTPSAPYGPWLRQWMEAAFLDRNRWLDVAYLVVAFPLVILEFAVAFIAWSLAIAFLAVPLVALLPVSVPGGLGNADPTSLSGPAIGLLFLVGVLLVPVASSVSRGLIVAHRVVVEVMLCVSPTEALTRDNERLRDTRAAALELEASELRRVERDLHDGAQQRLVMLAIDLALAEDKLASDPVAARTLIAGARDQARQALGELRDVVRGAAPAILLDRGLSAALSAIASRITVPTFVDSDLSPGERLPHSVERAAYYVVSEALTNVAKHSQATRCEVVLRRDAGRLVAEVRDDGAGGATFVDGGGLTGLRQRVEALDGRLELISPPGGPTILRAELPTGPV
jgi:signal transduction histidine kinase